MKIIKLDGVVGESILAKDVIAALKASSGDITINLNSAGGGVFDGVEIFNAIRNYDKGEITIIVGSLVASIASYFAMAADKVLVNDNSTLMIHNAHTISQGDYNSFEKTAKTLEGVTQLMRAAYSKRSGKSIEAIKIMLDKETFIFGEDIVAQGFADGVIVSGAEFKAEIAIKDAKEYIVSCANNCKIRFESDGDKVSALLESDKEQIERNKQAQQILKEVGIS